MTLEDIIPIQEESVIHQTNLYLNSKVDSKKEKHVLEEILIMLYVNQHPSEYMQTLNTKTEGTKL